MFRIGDRVVVMNSGIIHDKELIGLKGIVRKVYFNPVRIEVLLYKNKIRIGLYVFDPNSLKNLNRRESRISYDGYFTFDQKLNMIPQIKKVIFNSPKTIVIWADETKTVVSCGDGETFDYYTGFCAAITKKIFGSTSHAKSVLKKTMDDQNEKEDIVGGFSKIFDSTRQIVNNDKEYGIWKPINGPEDLPDEDKYDWVLVRVRLIDKDGKSYGVPQIAEFRYGHWYTDGCAFPLDDELGVKVTHWMPLPDDAKEE